ncbi:haloacid dehalogenase type II [Phyllobacterium sp. BT25]|uniref:Haloacid dehalogenase type II n=1 Tax=Phyllobacterium pellucidum TaxID=2740464 RepID=A0A849VWQ1_9HYPH|nr:MULTISPECIES: haloacid dehalogenase type II [Phyllobacterium]NTS32687.1 haloacid dehalogenase type II [Phyllobacterium pellucidum]UGY10065.1 haloacid dehalogenase type II [Phyllobacterium sp. T1018]
MNTKHSTPLEVRALLFDVLGTVVDWRSGIARQVSSFLERCGVVHVDAADFADTWSRLYDQATDAVRSGKRPFARLDVLNRENLEAAFKAVSIEPKLLPSADLDELNLAWHRLDPWPDSISGLTRLKSKFIIGPLSGGNTSLLLDMAKRAGLPWDVVLGSDVVEVYKPAPEAYLRTCEFLGLRPDQVLLVAAHNDDLAGARRCGMRTAFIPRPAEHGPSQTTDLAPLDDWDVIASDLVDLADKLGA